jgi:hypothetical protein
LLLQIPKINHLQQLNLPEFSFKLRNKDGKDLIFDTIRKKFVILTPEEWVRQNFIQYLIHNLNYPQGLIASEFGIEYNKVKFRPDIVVFNQQGEPYLIVECKAPEVSIDQKVFDQIARYNLNLKVEYLVVTNGMKHFCCRLDYEEKTYKYLDYIPKK